MVPQYKYHYHYFFLLLLLLLILGQPSSDGAYPPQLQYFMPATPPGADWQQTIHWLDRDTRDFKSGSCSWKLDGETFPSHSKL